MDSGLHFPPGFRFHPSDEELIVHYLRNKVTSHPLPASVIAEIDLYKYNPWELPKKALFGDEEWYFFSPRDRKYPNGTRPNRAAASGYWKATGTDKPILASRGSNSIGVKKALVFYIGKPPKGVKTDWIMNEYRLPDTTLIRSSRLRGSMRLDDWVLCRVRQRGSIAKNRGEVHDSTNTEMVRYLPDIEEGCPTYPISNADVVTDYLYKDCRLLASILAGHTLPPEETNSSVSFDGRNRVNSFTVNQESTKLSSQLTVSCFESQPNPLKRKASQENLHSNLFASNKKLDSGNKLEMNQYNHIHFHDNFFASNPPADNIIDFQEFNDMAFTDRYLQ